MKVPILSIIPMLSIHTYQTTSSPSLITPQLHRSIHYLSSLSLNSTKLYILDSPIVFHDSNLPLPPKFPMPFIWNKAKFSISKTSLRNIFVDIIRGISTKFALGGNNIFPFSINYWLLHRHSIPPNCLRQAKILPS